ncbi:MAG TPA: RsmE family RNA methyltransferase [Oculatellaceae cyanobacterium]|jgi:16S rRNA (uracil1498-N3)-methyltransferase
MVTGTHYVVSMETYSELKRFFAELPEAITNFPTVLELQDAGITHHLRAVLRAKAGESIAIADAKREMAYKATIVELQKDALRLQVENCLPSNPGRLPDVTLVAALTKEQRWDWMLQKTTELGVRRIQPLMSDRSVIRLTPDAFLRKKERWHAVLRSAAEQSEGCFIPDIEAPMTVAQYLESGKIPNSALRLFLRERGENRRPLRDAVRSTGPDLPIILAIGPEGGWSAEELLQFEQAGFEGVSFGQRVLRAETAAAAAMAALVYEYGE